MDKIAARAEDGLTPAGEGVIRPDFSDNQNPPPVTTSFLASSAVQAAPLHFAHRQNNKDRQNNKEKIWRA